MWPIIPTSFPPTLQVKTHGLNISKTSCDSSTNFASFNSWQKVDRETSVVKFGHHSRAHLEGLTKFWGFGGSSAPPYSPFSTFKSCMFDPKPLRNPTCVCNMVTLLCPPACGQHLHVYPIVVNEVCVQKQAHIVTCQSHQGSPWPHPMQWYVVFTCQSCNWCMNRTQQTRPHLKRSIYVWSWMQRWMKG